MIDQYGRNIDYMRISVTDRCNLRCRYCMPEGVKIVAMKDLLTFEEIGEAVSAAAELGIRKLKITGGEPLVRPQCCKLIALLKQTAGIEQVTMTTNGVLLEKHLPDLLAAGLDAVNISLDTLRRDRFAEITGRDDLPAVLSSLEAALNTRLKVKINVVLQKGVNEDERIALLHLARDRQLDVRFIEMMPIGFGSLSRGYSNTDLYRELREMYPGLTPDSSVHGSGPAVYYRIPEWQGSVGFISALHGKFCGTCNRIRINCRGEVKPCLCYGPAADLRTVLRRGTDADERKKELTGILRDVIYHKPKQHSFEDAGKITEQNNMISIGG